MIGLTIGKNLTITSQLRLTVLIPNKLLKTGREIITRNVNIYGGFIYKIVKNYQALKLP